MDATKMRLGLSEILLKYEIDNLALETELVEAVLSYLKDEQPARTSESIKKDIEGAILKGRSTYEIRQLVHETIAKNLLIPNGKDGEEFEEFAYIRALRGEDINVFVTWWLSMYPDPKFWSFNRMQQMWNLAFKKKYPTFSNAKPDKWAGNFVPPPEREK